MIAPDDGRASLQPWIAGEPVRPRVETGLAGLLFVTVVVAAISAGVTLTTVGSTCFAPDSAVGTRLVTTGAVTTVIACTAAVCAAVLRATLARRR